MSAVLGPVVHRVDPVRQRLRFDLLIAAAALLLLAAWDFSAADLRVSHLFADAQGSAWRDQFVLAKVLHDGGRMLGWVLLGVMLLIALRSPAAGTPARPPRKLQLQWIGVMLLCVTLVGLIKRFSLSSCPWELAEFGGVAHFVSHWLPGVRDGGPGGCFPSGHAVTAFAFFGAWQLWQLWRPWRPALARWLLLSVLVMGALFGAVQLVRGAHYVSHTLWTAWICWTLCALAAAWLHRHLNASDRRST